MKLNEAQVNAVTGAVWLVGIGVLLTTGRWWPGILFLAGAGTLTRVILTGGGWASLQGVLWLFGIGIWALLHYHLMVIFVLLALSGLLGAFVRPPALARKPVVDTSLD